MKNGVILAALSGVGSDASVLSAALTLSRLCACHVDALHATPDAYQILAGIVDGVAGIATSDMLVGIRQDIERRRTYAHDSFIAWAATNNIVVDHRPAMDPVSHPTASWRTFDGNSAAAVAQYGRLADLIVVAQPDGTKSGMQEDLLESAIFESGRPVLCVPPKMATLDTKRVALLWNGSLQSARAVGDAMPILESCESVTVVTAGACDGPDALDLVERLVSRGIDAQTKRVSTEHATVQEGLLAAVKSQQVGLVVMGGYGHSKLREMLLGGVTEFMLSESPVPTLLSH